MHQRLLPAPLGRQPLEPVLKRRKLIRLPYSRRPAPAAPRAAAHVSHGKLAACRGRGAGAGARARGAAARRRRCAGGRRALRACCWCECGGRWLCAICSWGGLHSGSLRRAARRDGEAANAGPILRRRAVAAVERRQISTAAILRKVVLAGGTHGKSALLLLRRLRLAGDGGGTAVCRPVRRRRRLRGHRGHASGDAAAVQAARARGGVDRRGVLAKLLLVSSGSWFRKLVPSA